MPPLFLQAVDGNKKQLEETVNYLIAYAVQHFGAEELIMIRETGMTASRSTGTNTAGL